MNQKGGWRSRFSFLLELVRLRFRSYGSEMGVSSREVIEEGKRERGADGRLIPGGVEPRELSRNKEDGHAPPDEDDR
jgi:hypothetical protein